MGMFTAPVGLELTSVNYHLIQCYQLVQRVAECVTKLAKTVIGIVQVGQTMVIVSAGIRDLKTSC